MSKSQFQKEYEEYQKYKEWQEVLCCKNAQEVIDFVMSNYLTEDEKCKTIAEQSQRIAELEEQLKNSIRPKFRVGQEIWYIEDKEIESAKIDDMWIEFCGETEPYFNLDLSDGLGLTSNPNNEKWSPHFGVGDYYVFATKEEAQERLKNYEKL